MVGADPVEYTSPLLLLCARLGRLLDLDVPYIRQMTDVTAIKSDVRCL